MVNKENILISVVEDSELFLKLIEVTLQQEGYTNITLYDSGRKFVESGEIPELLITDLHLQEKDNGFVISKQFRKKHPTSYVICITGDDSPLLQLDALASKVNKCIKKQSRKMKQELIKSVSLFATAITQRKELHRAIL